MYEARFQEVLWEASLGESKVFRIRWILWGNDFWYEETDTREINLLFLENNNTNADRMKRLMLAGFLAVLSVTSFAKEKYMNKNLKKELVQLERESLEACGHPLNESTQHKNQRYADEYFANYKDNVFADLSKAHRAQFECGKGGELSDKEYPAKMKSILSSSAMTYNILGNNEICAKAGNHFFTPGTYKIEYEKQLLTVRSGKNSPAHLDAFLLSGTDAIFCEMKMTEWLRGNPGLLRHAYFEDTNFFSAVEGGTDALTAFKKLRDLLCDEMSEAKDDDGYDSHRFGRYDAWQMYKHILGIYNMSSAVTKNEISACQTDAIKMLPKLENAVLVNVIFEPSAEVFSDSVQKVYCDAQAAEHEEFSVFKNCVEKSGVIAVFKKDCGIDFSVELLTAAEFIDCFNLADRADYLQRYRLENRS